MGADSKDKVKRNGRSDQLFLERINFHLDQVDIATLIDYVATSTV